MRLKAVKKILLFILAITSNSTFANEKFGDWDAGLTSGKAAYFASPTAEVDNVSLVLFFDMRSECKSTVSASIRTNTSGDVKAENKDKAMYLIIDKGLTWGADKVTVSKDGYYLRVGLVVSKGDKLISALKKGNKVELEIGSLPVVEFSLKGASKALSSAENKCNVAVATDDLLK